MREGAAVRGTVDVVRVTGERGQAPGDEHLAQALGRQAQIGQGAEPAEALAEDGPGAVALEVAAQEFGVAHDRVGTEVGEVGGRVLDGGERGAVGRCGAARAALVEQDDPVVLEGAAQPSRPRWAAPRGPGSALEPQEPGQVAVFVLLGDDLAGEQGDRRAVGARVVERYVEGVVVADETAVAVGGHGWLQEVVRRRGAPREGRPGGVGQ